MSILLLLLTAMASLSTPGFPYPDFTLKCYPEAVMPGDTLYIMIVANNHHPESIYIHNDYLPITRDIQTCLRNTEEQTQPLLFESQTSEEFQRALIYAGIPPKDSRIIGALSINVPSLEDLKEPFWEKHLKNLSASGEGFTLCATVISYSATNQEGDSSEYERLPFMLEMPVVMKQRPGKEMTLIEDWYSQTPKSLFPKPYGKNPLRKMPSQGFMLPESKVIHVENLNHDQWHFIRFGNRYPADPNAPATWQGWRELEESITPSTMRDEIRLTRILIQYCDTKDEKVLDELKEWFANMNEVQRACMAKSIRDRARGCYGTDLLAPFRDLYKAIREYDIAAKTEREIEWLKKLGLLE